MLLSNQTHGNVASSIDAPSLSDDALIGHANAIANGLSVLSDKGEKLELLEDYMRVRNELKERSIDIDIPDIFSDKKRVPNNGLQNIIFVNTCSNLSCYDSLAR